ncbi:MAG TPA: mycothiol synthase [Streptosporangiaceae bacterium]|nr:mycothiol synthase [Streptosporangiaceae bacterium]
MRVTVQGRLGHNDTQAVLSLAQAAEAADGVGPLSEATQLHVRDGGDRAATNVLAWHGLSLAGYAHLGAADPDGGRTGELTVQPSYRRHGLGKALTRVALAEVGPVPVRFWAHGDLAAAAGLARVAGFTRVRELWRMHRQLEADLAEPRLPPGVSIGTFTPGEDEGDWLALNGRAFADHPEQGRWVMADLARREQEPWFDTAGFLLARRDGALVGFHWTKTHVKDGTGEVYVVGVDPAEQGNGLGRALTVAGLRYLRGEGVGEAFLYVDAGNAAAIRMYSSLGFTHDSTDVVYQHPPLRQDSVVPLGHGEGAQPE